MVNKYGGKRSGTPYLPYCGCAAKNLQQKIVAPEIAATEEKAGATVWLRYRSFPTAPAPMS
jgi:hypothetical protein